MCRIGVANAEGRAVAAWERPAEPAGAEGGLEAALNGDLEKVKLEKSVEVAAGEYIWYILYILYISDMLYSLSNNRIQTLRLLSNPIERTN